MKIENVDSPVGSPAEVPEQQIPEVVVQVVARREVSPSTSAGPSSSVSTPTVILSAPRRELPTKAVAPILSSSPLPRPQTATSKLFQPRTEEMNKGFLMFSDDEPGLTSKFLLFLYIYL